MIEVIFKDMQRANNLFDEQKNPSDDSDDSNSIFIKTQNAKAREFIKRFLGEYIANCVDNKYRVLELIMKKVVIGK